MLAHALSENTRLARVELRTASLGRLLPFYEQVIGLAAVQSSAGQATLGVSEARAGFLKLVEEPHTMPHPRFSTGLYHFAILHPTRKDLAFALKRLVSHDWAIEGAANHLVSEAIYLRDPDGNGIELYADVPRSEWRWDDGQVRMATEPLNLDGLLSLAENEDVPEHPPALTRLGHIHLHVADLREAERFFHQFLGFAVTQRSYPGALFFAAGGYHHHVGANTWAGKVSPPANSAGLVAYRFEVPETEVLQRLEVDASRFGYETAKDSAQDGSGILKVKDPSGNWVEITSAKTATVEVERVAIPQ